MTSRRTMATCGIGPRRCAVVAVGVALAVLAAEAAAQAAPRSVTLGKRCRVTLTEGAAAGVPTDGTCLFRGLRYAAAPVGDLRFKAPRPAPRWRGARRLSASTNVVCPRVAANTTESYAGDQPASDDEDCLRVNVTAPAGRGRARPVLVYLHGGAFIFGSGAQADFDGRSLARRGGAIVVTVNYRLGLLGYLELGRRSVALEGSGNNGLRDQMAALRWVRRNAAAFGGDPKRITVFGQSAGAISISAMLAGENPRRLFRRAIVQSGSGYLVHTRQQADAAADEAFSLANVSNADQLQTMPIHQLLDVQRRLLERHPISGDLLFAPYVDGNLVPGPPITRIGAGSARDVDLLIGTTADETMFYALHTPVLAYLPAAANPVFPSQLRTGQVQMIAVYGRNRQALGLLPGWRGTTMAMIGDQLFRIPAIRQAQAQSAHNARTYMYRFDWRPDAPAGTPPEQDVGAMHCLELPFVFGTLRFDWIPHATTRDPTELARRRTLSERMMDAWLSFARTGNPNWTPYEKTRRTTMLWDDNPHAVGAPADDERALWDAYPFEHVNYELPVG